jgi:hypothetical protein
VNVSRLTPKVIVAEHLVAGMATSYRAASLQMPQSGYGLGQRVVRFCEAKTQARTGEGLLTEYG